MSAIRRRAQSVASAPNSQGYGFSVAIISMIAEYAIPAFIRCWLNSQTDAEGMSAPEKSAKLKKLAEDNWEDGAHSYDRRLIKSMRRHTREAAVKAGQRLSPPELDVMSAAMLDQARLSDEAEIADCLTEVATIDLSTFPDPGVV